MYGKGYNISGWKEFSASISANSVKSRYYGFPTISFKNTGNVIQAQYPNGIMQGTAFGRRYFYMDGKFYIYDLENRLYCEMEFNLSSDSIFKKNKNSKDSFVGKIWRINTKFVEKLKKMRTQKREISISFKEKKYAVEELATVEGTWPDSVSVNGKKVWSYGKPWGYEMQYFDSPLPSDSNYRSDINYLKAGDEKKAQDAKVAIEESQRKDRKLRDNYESKRKH